MREEKRLKVLYLPTEYLSEETPVGGIFIRRHAEAASLYNDVVVLYAYPEAHPRLGKLCRITEGIEDGIRTIRVRYGVIPQWFRTGSNKARETRSSLWRRLVAMPSYALRIPRGMINDLLYYGSIFIAFRRLVKQGWKPDIIHAHVFVAGVPAVILGKLYGIPVIVTEHWTVFLLRQLTLFGRMKARFAMKRARMILPVSNALKEAIEAYGIQGDFRVVSNVVNTEVFQLSPFNTESGSDRRKRILFVAILSPQKGVPYLLEALSLISRRRKDFALDIVGDGPYKREYEELTRKLGLDGTVKFHGVRTGGEVARFMMDCDFLVQPSLWETFGVVYIEAMACGKPVIASNIPGPNEFINADVGILVPPKDVDALAKAINFMLDHHGDYSSEKVSRYARERFSCEVVGRMLNEVYEEVAATSGGGRSI